MGDAVPRSDSRRPDSTDAIPVLFEDEHLLVVAKPARCLVVQAAGRAGPTITDLIGRQLGGRVHAVHRLDEDTTGVLVLARSLDAKESLEEVFRTHSAIRTYLALTTRVPSPPAGRVESSLAVGPDGVVRSVQRGGERAVTTYRTRERRPGGALVECVLDTGRRNQIRVHLADLGCPIVGDRKYGWRARRNGPRPARPLLHAWRIEFRHPITGAELSIESLAEESDLAPPSAG